MFVLIFLSFFLRQIKKIQSTGYAVLRIRDVINVIRDVHPGSGYLFLPIPDPGVKKAPDPGTWIRIRNTGVLVLH
jgi:hypothetical protein